MWFPIVRVGVWQLFRETFKKTLSANRKCARRVRFARPTSRLAMDDADKRKSGAGEKEPPKIKAEHNPWYLLATLYGVPEEGNDELRNKNRAAWNRYSAANLSEQTRARLIEEKPHLAEELRPFLPEEPERLQEIKDAFAKRYKDLGKNLQFPAGDSFIDFSNVEFDRDVFFDGYVFAKCSFRRASFSGKANFFSASFLGTAAFSGCTFSELTQFNSVMSMRRLISGSEICWTAHVQKLDFRGERQIQRCDLL
jgi:hypothetical protein